MHKFSSLSIDEMAQLIAEGVPMVGQFDIAVTEMGAGRAVLRMPCHDRLARPGGTITGPAMFGLADVALWAAILSRIGKAEMTVTTSMTINFLRKPEMRTMIAIARVLKLGKRLAYGDVLLYTEGDDDPVAHANGTYSIPPSK